MVRLQLFRSSQRGKPLSLSGYNVDMRVVQVLTLHLGEGRKQFNMSGQVGRAKNGVTYDRSQHIYNSMA